MPYDYEGPATVTVMALRRGRLHAELSTLEMPVVMRDAGLTRARIEYGHYLKGPRDANVLRLMLPDGRMLQGPIIDGRKELLGGWLEFDVEQEGRALDQSADLND